MKTDDGWQNFLRLCLKAKDRKQFEELLILFLTIEERRDIALRVALVKALLSQKQTQREIAADLGISISRITRGSNALKTISQRLKKALKEMV